MLYGKESWPVKHSHIKEIKVAEIRMPQWMCGLIRRDRNRYRGQGRSGLGGLQDGGSEAEVVWTYEEEMHEWPSTEV